MTFLKEYKFNKYYDDDIGLDKDILENLMESSEYESRAKNINDKEEDFSSDSSGIANAQKKCYNDLYNALDDLREGNIKELYHFNKNTKYITTDDTISKIKAQILNVPEYDPFNEDN